MRAGKVVYQVGQSVYMKAGGVEHEVEAVYLRAGGVEHQIGVSVYMRVGGVVH
jgi:hypothetical protein